MNINGLILLALLFSSSPAFARDTTLWMALEAHDKEARTDLVNQGFDIVAVEEDRVIALCTSVAAASMFFSSANWSVSDALPCVLFDVTISKPGICMNWRSSGVAMFAAMVSALAPG